MKKSNQLARPIAAGVFSFFAAMSVASPLSAETIAMIGTGNVAGALGPEFAAQGHDIVSMDLAIRAAPRFWNWSPGPAAMRRSRGRYRQLRRRILSSSPFPVALRRKSLRASAICPGKLSSIRLTG